jgi:predicted AAA+ superfamily ATPase
MKATDQFPFSQLTLSPSLIADLRRMNPWWEGQPQSVLPETRRHLVKQIHTRLTARLAPIVVVRGPRQIGKTIAQMQVVDDLLKNGVTRQNILRVQTDELESLRGIDEPILRIVEWYEANVLRETLNAAAHRRRPTYLLFDEVQNLKDWDVQLKHLVDHATTQAVVTGSSALRIGLGRDSLAGRITTIEAGVLSLTEIAAFNGMGHLDPFLPDNGLEPLTQRDFWVKLAKHGRDCATVRDQSFKAFSDRGGYPLAHQRSKVSWSHIADQLNANVIERVMKHDLRVGERGRKRDPALLEELFRLACRYVGQSPRSDTLAREVQRVLRANVGPQRITHYLRFLSDTLLLRLIEPLEIRLKRKRGNPKICLADHALRASWLQEMIPLDEGGLQRDPHLHDLAGRIAESVAGSLFCTIGGLDVAHLPARGGNPEVDFVLTIGTKRIPVEVKYTRRLDQLADTEGLRTFIETAVNNAPFGLLITLTDSAQVHDPRIVSLPLATLMLLR